MPDPTPSPVPKSVTSLFPALAVLAFAIGMLVWAQTYSEIARRFPSLVAGTLAVSP